MNKLLCLMVFAPFIAKTQVAQTSSGVTATAFNYTKASADEADTSVGIAWIEGLSWQGVKEKATRENKYIFLDCFTTWCGPCKKMDKEVYVDNHVGKYFNDKFISVKVQMDRTKNDNSFIQNWYKDADEIRKHYFLEGYPSFLFFSPKGVIVHKETGFIDGGKLIAFAQIALTPGKILNDDFAEYQELLVKLKRGEILYDRLPFMVNVAKKMGDTISRKLIRLHTDYVSTLAAKERYTKENIAFWVSLNLSVKSDLLQFIFRDGDKVDKVMNKKGYAATQVDKCIQNFVVDPFLSNQYKNPEAKSGVTTINAATGVQVSNAALYDETDWKKLYQLIRKDFNNSYAKINVLQAKAIWYEKNSNWIAYTKASLKKFKKDPPDFDDWLESGNVNDLGWNVFLQIKDKDLINECITWMGKLVKKRQDWSDGLDTYANLLYKFGRNEEAIQWQEKAVNLDPTDQWHQKALAQMKKGESTYGVK
jgi:thioredoxin-related protein